MRSYPDDRIPLTQLPGCTVLRLGSCEFELDNTKAAGRGSTCLVYRAWEYDGTANPRRIILKEFYPLAPGCGSWRNPDGSLTLPAGTPEIAWKETRFRQSYDTFKTLFNRDELNLYTVQTQKIIGSREPVNGTVYLVMDYGSADSMDDYLASEPGLFDFLTVMKSLAVTLDHVHAAGFLHMDLKPENLLCMENRFVRLMDTDSFLRKADFQGENHDSIILSASRGYAAPEVLQYTGEYFQRKRFAAMGERADLFSFGAILHRYLFGVPVTEDTPDWEPRLEQALLRRERNLPGRAVSLTRKLLCRTLARHSTDRYTSMSALMQDLDALLPLVDPAKPRILENFRRNPHPILGREQALEALRDSLEGQQEASRLVCITGPGGIGKSALAKAFAERFRDHYVIITEVSASGAAEVVQRIPIANWEPGPEEKDPITACQNKVGDLCREHRTLLIVHDYDVAEDGQFAIFYSLGCDILLTSRRDWSLSGIPAVALSSTDLPADTAAALFRQFYLEPARKSGDRQREALLLSFLAADRAALKQLLAALDHHPLGIKLTARQMAAVPGMEMLPGQTLRELQQEGFPREAPQKYQNDQVSAVRFSNSYGHLAAIFRTARKNSRLSRNQLEALRYMTLVSASWGISADRFARLSGLDRQLPEALRQLGWVEFHSRQQDLLDKEGQSGVYVMPLVIQGVLRKEPDMVCTTKNSAGFLAALSHTFPGSCTRQERLAYSDHQQVLVQALSAERSSEYARLLKAREYGLYSMDGSRQAGEHLIEYARKRLEIYRQLPGCEQQQLVCCNRLSRYYYELADLRRSTEFMQQAMALEAQFQLPASNETLSLRISLGNLLWEQGQWEAAIALNRELFDRFRAHPEYDPLLTLNVWYNLAYFLLRSGSFQTAETMLLQLVESPGLYEKDANTDMRLQLLTLSLYRLGQLYLENGLAGSALECFRQSLEIHTHRWGETHLFQAKLYGQLAEAFLQQGNAEEARLCHIRELEISFQNQGSLPCQVGICLANLALDCALIPEQKAQAGQYWQQARQYLNSRQTDLLVTELSDLRELLHIRAKHAFRDGVIHEGLKNLEASVKLCIRCPQSPEQPAQEYRTLAQIFTHYDLPDRGNYYLTLAQS